MRQLALLRGYRRSVGINHARCFHASRLLLDDDVSRRKFKKLGASLQRGNLKATINQEDGETANTPTGESTPKSPSAESTSHLAPSASKSDSDHPNRSVPSSFLPLPLIFDDNSNVSKDCIDALFRMSPEALAIQRILDGGKQLFSQPSQHFLNRKALIRKLPAEIDIFNPEDMERVDDIYSDLEKLDKDKTVHMKYYKRFLNKWHDPIVVMKQEYNGIATKFKKLRRGEDVFLKLDLRNFESDGNYLRLPYNVVGFDKSISGIPLDKDLALPAHPREFIQDLSSFSQKVPIHKNDLDFIEPDEQSFSFDANWFKNAQKYKRGFFNSKSKVGISLPKHVLEKTIQLDLSRGYNILEASRPLGDQLIESIRLLKKKIEQVITARLDPSPSSRYLLPAATIKSNRFQLYQHNVTRQLAKVAVRHDFCDFNIIPNYAYVLTTRSRIRRLESHLKKVFRMNLEQELSQLTNILSQGDKSNAIGDVNDEIQRVVHTTIARKLVPRIAALRHVNALIHEPYGQELQLSCYKRLLWVKKLRKSDRTLRRSISISLLSLNHLEDVVEHPNRLD